VRDDNGDGIEDLSVRGALIGHAQATGTTKEYRALFELTGLPDETPPGLVVPAPVHPFDGIRMLATEPVTLNSTLTLDGGLTVLPEPTSGRSKIDFFADFSVLPFSTRFEYRARLEDFAGNQASVIAELSTLEDPGELVDGEFEDGELVAIVEGGAELVESVAGIPALAGETSLFIPPGTRVTFHVKRPPGAKSVWLNTRHLRRAGSSFEQNSPLTDILAGAIGGNMTALAEQPDLPGMDLDDPEWDRVYPARELSLAIVGDQIDVVVSVKPFGCPDPCNEQLNQFGVLVDSIRLE
jgi:hypothetical protein